MFRLMPYGKLQNDLVKRKDVFDTFFDNFFDDMMEPIAKLDGQFQSFKVDVLDQGDQYLIEADLPGFKKEDVNIEYDNNYLTISAVSQSEEAEEGNRFIRRERRYGEFRRSFYVENINLDDVEARFENGVLRIILKKNLVDKARRTIEIKE